MLGIWVEETDALAPEDKNSLVMTGELKGMADEYSCGFHCDIIHSRGAKVLASYGSDFYAGTPVMTENTYGKGKAYYIGTEPNDTFLADFVAEICKENDIKAPFEVSDAVEVTKRVNDRNETVFALNYDKENEGFIDLGEGKYIDLIKNEEVTGKTSIAPYDVRVLKKL